VMASSLIAVVQAACGSKWRCENAMAACLVAELALVGVCRPSTTVELQRFC